jgi:hypothetical protein
MRKQFQSIKEVKMFLYKEFWRKIKASNDKGSNSGIIKRVYCGKNWGVQIEKIIIEHEFFGRICDNIRLKSIILKPGVPKFN